jgi:hypothetical protein
MSNHECTSTPDPSQSRPFIIPVNRVGLITDPRELDYFREFLDTPEIHPACDTLLRRTIDGEVFDPTHSGAIDQDYLQRVRLHRAAAHIADRRR